MLEPKNAISAVFILIFVYLLLAKPGTTNQVITSLSSGATGLIATLQGRDIKR